ncbi:MAG: GNVR domain-containing protein, partial [Candidatus Coprenecus sp.]|nr:GNVR domain-containing protein [Candidatus Coprenecus sp.]
MENNTINTPNTEHNSEELFSIKDIIFVCLANWKWFVISLAVCLSLSVLYVLRTHPTYTRTASIMIKDDKKGQSFGSEMSTFSDMGLFKSGSNVHNELLAIQSPSIMTEVVKRLKLDVSYMVPGKFHKQVAYGNSQPVIVTFETIKENETASFIIELNPDMTFSLTDFKFRGEEFKDEPIVGILGKNVKTPAGNIRIDAFHLKPLEEVMNIYVTKSSLYSAVNSYMANLTVALSSKEATVLNFTCKDKSIQRAEDIINTVIAVYNENWVKDKNQIAISSAMFINDRLKVIEQELGVVDENISSFKKDNLLPDINAASTMYFQKSDQITSQILMLNNQLYMAEYIQEYMKKETNKMQLLPANSGIENSNIENLIGQYNNMLLKRNSLVSNSSEKNPLVVDLDIQLASVRSAIDISIENHILTLNTQIASIQQAESRTTEKLAASPTQAKYLLSVERQQKVKESLYIFLLQKREENELSKAFTAYNTRIITPPTGSMAPTAPVTKKIYLIAFALGLFIPIGVIVLVETMNTKVRGKKDIDNLSIPFLGEIPYYGKKKKFETLRRFIRRGSRKGESRPIVVKEGNRDVINEAFRVLRTNIEFVTEKNESTEVLSLTSFNPGSGKSLISANLSVSLAIKDKKVLLIDGDLRRAAVSELADSPNVGLANYLAGKTD